LRATALDVHSSAASRRVVGTVDPFRSYALPPYGGSSSSSWSTPYRPEAINPATARYGLTSPPGTRCSNRNDGPWPTTRNAHVRLSRPHAIAVGANDSDW